MEPHESTRFSAAGSGPGPITGDGCPVDLYAALESRGEPELVHEAAKPGATVLELGCGTGRISTPLARLGHRVVGVDESADMLEHCVGIETVRAQIQTLRLKERSFDVVLLPSHLINTEDEAVQKAFLRTCRAHIEVDGMVVIQRHRRGWIETATDTVHDDGTLRSHLQVLGQEPGRLHGRMTYQLGDAVWHQEFTARDVTDEALPGLLAEADLRLDRILTDDGAWFVAVPLG